MTVGSVDQSPLTVDSNSPPDMPINETSSRRSPSGESMPNCNRESEGEGSQTEDLISASLLNGSCSSSEGTEKEEKHPSFIQVSPPNSDLIPNIDPSRITLGRLFTEGGYKHFLIRVLEHVDQRDLVNCLKVCKNTNAVMVKTSTVQVKLRCLLFGMGVLPMPTRYIPKHSDYPDPHSISNPFNCNSKQTVENVNFTQRCFQNSQYTKIRPNPIALGTIKPEDMQGATILLTHETVWSVIADMVACGSVQRERASSVIAMCAEDGVVVEASGFIGPLGNNDALQKLVRARFMCLNNAGNTGFISPKHPQAKLERLRLYIPEPGSSTSDQQDIKIRLYPGGLGAALLCEGHDCDAQCSGSDLARELTTRLVVFNWHQATGFGVIKVSDPAAKILDFRFLSDLQIICSSIRTIDGYTYPCIDIYDIPQTPVPYQHDIIYTNLLPQLSLMGSVRFPRLAASKSGCISAQLVKSTSRITNFHLKVSNPSRLTAVTDQVATFQIDGLVGRKSEQLQGVILLSRLRNILLQANNDEDKSTRMANSSKTPSSPIPWEEWFFAVSFSKSKLASIPQPRCTQVVNLARSRKDKTHAVLMIRDYNQRMLLAPPGCMHRSLGHPIDNQPLKVDENSDNRVNAPTADWVGLNGNFKSIESILFGQTVKYGLGHRLRMVDVGKFTPNTASSLVCGDSAIMSIFARLPDSTTAMYMLGFMFVPDEKLAKDFEKALTQSPGA